LIHASSQPVTGVCLEIKLEATPVDLSETFLSYDQEWAEADKSSNIPDFVYLWVTQPRCRQDGRIEFTFQDSAYLTSDKRGLNAISVRNLEDQKYLTIRAQVRSSVSRPNICWAFKPETMDELHKECGFNPYGQEVAQYLRYSPIEVYPIGKHMWWNTASIFNTNMPMQKLLGSIFGCKFSTRSWHPSYQLVSPCNHAWSLHYVSFSITTPAYTVKCWDTYGFLVISETSRGTTDMVGSHVTPCLFVQTQGYESTEASQPRI
jgi:hypothetical protein